MCIAAAAIPAATLAVSAVSTVASIGLGIMSASMQAQQAQASLNYQAQAQRQQMEMQRQQMILQQDQQHRQLALQQKQTQDNHNLQVAQANAQILNQYNSQRRQVLNERAQLMKKHEGDRIMYQRSVELANKQYDNNNEAANRIYVAEQTKIQEARKKAAFEQQGILAKSIGNAGNVLAAGRTGQSIGLLLNDVERQKGFAIAQADATFASQQDAALIAMEGGFLQAQSANNQAQGQIGFNPTAPYLPAFPDAPAYVNGIGVGMSIPGYSTGDKKARKPEAYDV